MKMRNYLVCEDGWPAERAGASLNAMSGDRNFWKQINFLEPLLV
jgi:hypothetical protein